jgi:flagellar biosynthesis/type III secretory pathway chaperone
MDRERLITGMGDEASPEQFDAFLAQHDSTGQLAMLADELRKELDTCFQMNRVNGGIAELSYHYLSHSLAILRGGEGQNETTYGPQGKTSTAGDSHRTLAKA